MLAACALSGVTRIFRIGGAQAVAALAYGTATVPRVDKIVGPGNRWVAEAKRQVVGQVGIDMIAGPTEVLVLADHTARPERVAADLIAQAEHDEDAVSWCVTTDPALAEALPAALRGGPGPGAPRRPSRGRRSSGTACIVLVPSMREAIEVANRRAPEHLEIVAEGAERVAGRSATRGRSSWATTPPSRSATTWPARATSSRPAGTARYASPLGVYDFVKRTSVIRYTRARLADDAEAIIALAEAEGLYGHAEAVRIRTAVSGERSAVGGTAVAQPASRSSR